MFFLPFLDYCLAKTQKMDAIAHYLPLFLQSHPFSILASIINSRLRFTEFLYDAQLDFLLVLLTLK